MTNGREYEHCDVAIENVEVEVDPVHQRLTKHTEEKEERHLTKIHTVRGLESFEKTTIRDHILTYYGTSLRP